MIQKLRNIQMEAMREQLLPLLPHRDKVGYAAARNMRMLSDALTEYMEFKHDLIIKYGSADKDADGNDLGTVSIKPTDGNFPAFKREFDAIKDIEHEVTIMTLKYDEVIGILNGEEILTLDWMLED